MNCKIRLKVMSIVMILYFTAEIWLQVMYIRNTNNMHFAYIIPIYVLYILCGVIGVIASIRVSLKKMAVGVGVVSAIVEVIIVVLKSQVRFPVIQIVYIILALMLKEEKA